jgi:hypothetical protein
MADFKKYRHLITDGMWAGNKYIPRPQKYRPLKRRKPRVLKLPDKYVDELVRLNNECTYDYDTPCLENFEPSRDLLYSYGELVDCDDPRARLDGLGKKGRQIGPLHKRRNGANRKKYKRPEELGIRPSLPEQEQNKAGVIKATKGKSLEQVREERLLLHESASAAQKRWKQQRLKKRMLDKEQRLKKRMIIDKMIRLVGENKLAEARKHYEILKRLSI